MYIDMLMKTKETDFNNRLNNIEGKNINNNANNATNMHPL